VVANLFRVGFYYPLSSFEQFPLALPLLLGFAWRDQDQSPRSTILCRNELGGMLNYYYREAV